MVVTEVCCVGATLAGWHRRKNRQLSTPLKKHSQPGEEELIYQGMKNHE